MLKSTSGDYRNKLPSPNQLGILRLLKKEGPLTGTDLHNGWDYSMAHIYVHLSRMRKKGLVAYDGVPKVKNGTRPNKITPFGKSVLKLAETVGALP